MSLTRDDKSKISFVKLEHFSVMGVRVPSRTCPTVPMEKGCRFHIPIMDKVHSLLLRLSKIFSSETLETALHRKFGPDPPNFPRLFT